MHEQQEFHKKNVRNSLNRKTMGNAQGVGFASAPLHNAGELGIEKVLSVLSDIVVNFTGLFWSHWRWLRAIDKFCKEKHVLRIDYRHGKMIMTRKRHNAMDVVERTEDGIDVDGLSLDECVPFRAGEACWGT